MMSDVAVRGRALWGVAMAAACAGSGAPPPAAAEQAPPDPHGLSPLARRIVRRGASPELRAFHGIDTSVHPWQERFAARWDQPDPSYVPDPHSARSPH